MSQSEVFLDQRQIALVGPAAADVQEVEPGVYSVLLGGSSFEVRVYPEFAGVGQAGLAVEIRGKRFHAEVRNPRDARRLSAASQTSARQNVTSPMSGKVVRVLVTEGQAVEAGQSLVVVEAMKMQNEMKAALAGTVSKFAVKAGASIAAGQVLMVIE